MNSYWLSRMAKKQYFYGLLVGFALIVVHVFMDMLPNRAYLDGSNLNFTAITTWIGIGGSTDSYFSALFYLLLPLFSVIGLNLIVFEDKQTGFIKQYVQKKGIINYSIHSFSLSFISGFLIGILPLLLDLLVAWCLFPNQPLDAVLNNNLGLASNSTYFMKDLFQQSYTGILFYILLAGLFAGVFSVVATSVSLYVKTIYSVVSFSFLLCLFISVLAAVFPFYPAAPLSLPMVGGPAEGLPPLSFIMGILFLVLIVAYLFNFMGVKRNAII